MSGLENKSPINTSDNISNISKKQNKPLVFSCSGCSNLGEMAHNISLTLDGDSIAEMSCVSGVVAKAKPIMNALLADRAIITLDGCDLACTKYSLDSHGINTDLHFTMSDLGFKKRGIWHDSLVENSRAIKSVYTGLLASGLTLA